MEQLIPALGVITSWIITIGICVVLPVMVVWIVNKRKKNDTDRKTEIMLAAIEKNADVGNMEEILKGLTPPQENPEQKAKRRMQSNLMCGTALTVIGAAIITAYLISAIMGYIVIFQAMNVICFLGVPALAFGIGMLLAYRAAKKTLAKTEEDHD